MQKTIKVPDVAHVVIIGPSGCGKSIVMDRIAKMLESEFGALVVSPDLQHERNGNDYDNLDGWQKDIVSRTTWFLSEDCKSD